jgi:histidine ammonia-lyase
VRALLAAPLIGLTHGGRHLARAAERIAAMLNKRAHPVVPSVASVGESDPRHARTRCRR